MVQPVYDLFLKRGLAWKEQKLFWIGRSGSAQQYQLTGPDSQTRQIKIISFLCEDEKIIFRAFQDLFAGAICKLSEVLRGYFTFDVIQFEIMNAPWAWADFTALLTAHSKKLAVGERRLIQFGALWGVLHRRTEADFGRIESKLELTFCKPGAEAAAKFIKKQMVALATVPFDGIIFYDLSRDAFFAAESDFEILKVIFKGKESILDKKETCFYVHASSKSARSVSLLS